MSKSKLRFKKGGVSEESNNSNKEESNNLESNNLNKKVSNNIERLKKYGCVFKKEYDEPKEKYNIFSFCVFYMSKYIRFFKNFSKDITEKRQLQFLYNLTLNIQNVEQGFFGDNWYIRIFYDKSLFLFRSGNTKPWVDFIAMYKNHPKVQFVEFKCNEFLNKNVSDCHLNLFPTMVRLHPIFEKNPLVNVVSVCDSDNVIPKGLFDELVLFEKSNYDYQSLCSSYEFSYYKNNSANDPDNCYIRCGMLAVKKKLPEVLWYYVLYQMKTVADEDYDALLKKLYDYHYDLFPEKKIKSYKDFEYGTDEIVLNFYIKRFFVEGGYKMRVVRYRPIIMPIINTIIGYMEYNVRKGNKELVQKILKNILNNEYKNNLKEDLNRLNQLFYKNTTLESNYDEVEPYLILLKKEIGLFDKLGLPRSIMRFLKDVGPSDYEGIKPFSAYLYSYNFPNYLKLCGK